MNRNVFKKYSLLYPTINCSVWLPLKRDYASEWCELLLILCYMYMYQAFFQHQFATVAEARRVNANYVITGVNSKDSIQISCKFLADVWIPCFLFPSLHQEATTHSATLLDFRYVVLHPKPHLLFIIIKRPSSVLKKKVG